MLKNCVSTIVWILIVILLAGCGSSATTTPVLPTNTPGADTPSPPGLTPLEGAYLGQNPPGKTPRMFAPGVISVDANFEHSAAVFSPDNNEVFWCTNVDWYTDDRVVGDQRLHYMKMVDGKWTAPQIAPFTKEINVPVQRPVFSPDGNKLYIEYGSDPNRESDADIYVVERIGEGWSEPVPVSPLINSPAMERLHCVTADGSLYFSRDPFTANEEIFVSRFVNGAFTEPEKLGKSYNSDDYEVAILIAPNEEYMLIEQMDTQHTSSNLTISYKRADGSWSDRVRTSYECGGFLALSPDGEYLFFLGEGIYWVNTSFIDDLKPSNADRLPEASYATISMDTADQVERLRTLSGHSAKVTTLAFSGDGVYVASSSLDNTIKLWDARSGQEIHTFNSGEVDMNGITFSPDGNLLASAEAIWDVESKQVVHALDQNGFGPVAFSLDGSLLAVGLIGQPIKLWDVASGQVARTFDERADNDTFSIAFSPDGALLAAGGHSGVVRLWDVETGQVARTFEHGAEIDVHDVAFSPDGSVLASGGIDSTVRLWDVASGQLLHTLRHRDGLMSVAFSPDGKIVASAGVEYTVSLWDVESGTRLRTLPHDDELMAVAFSPDGLFLASGGYDNQVYLWGVPR